MKTLTFLLVLLILLSLSINKAALGQENVFPASGNVGIGRTNPTTTLHVDNRGGTNFSTTAITDHIFLEGGGTIGRGEYGPSIGFGKVGGAARRGAAIAVVQTTNNSDQTGLAFFTHPSSSASNQVSEVLRIEHDGNVGIGTTDPNTKLDVNGAVRITNQGDGAVLLNLSSERHWEFRQRNTGSSTALELASASPGGNKAFIINTSGNVGIGMTNPQSKLDVAGTTRTQVIEITGGSDLAEPFEIAGAESIKPGMVVSIDPEHPGQLLIAHKTYDRTAAGIVSGANGLNPGLTMKQKGSAADGTFPVALTGRVYCWADASNGSIQPGDLLTTSDTPGHAMKATDYSKAHGAIIGKAMSSLETSRGLILVLVTLQ
ncbi:MAG: hypothetical protein MN733_01875 [Nitrososphaera sp.]|nr:hypothetical protein [Nitrososphaera sp.]